MTTLTPDELAVAEMQPTWEALHAIAAMQEALTRFLREELPADVKFDAAGLTTTFGLCAEFDVIWPHRVPTKWELVAADRAGRLPVKIAELNEAFHMEHQPNKQRVSEST